MVKSYDIFFLNVQLHPKIGHPTISLFCAVSRFKPVARKDIKSFRYDDWKVNFMEQRVPGTMLVWGEPFVKLRVPHLYNLRYDPYEYASITSDTYYDWCQDHAFIMVPAQDIVANFLMTFKEFPPRMKAASFNIDKVMETLSTPVGN